MGENLRNRVADRVNRPSEATETMNGAADEAQQPDAPQPTVMVGVTREYQAPPDPAQLADVPVQTALARVMASVQGVGKNDRHDSPQAKFMFRGIDAVMNAVGPALRAHGVIVMPKVLDVSHRDVTTSGGKPSRECTVLVEYTFVGPRGDTLTTVVPGESMDTGDKGTAKAMSVAFRIALLQALCLPTDEPDPDHFAYERAAAPQHPADAARDKLAEVSADLKLPFIAVRKAFAYREGVPISACGDAGVLLAFASELAADPQTVLATPKPGLEPNQEPSQNGQAPAETGAAQ